MNEKLETLESIREELLLWYKQKNASLMFPPPPGWETRAIYRAFMTIVEEYLQEDPVYPIHLWIELEDKEEEILDYMREKILLEKQRNLRGTPSRTRTIWADFVESEEFLEEVDGISLYIS